MLVSLLCTGPERSMEKIVSRDWILELGFELVFYSGGWLNYIQNINTKVLTNLLRCERLLFKISRTSRTSNNCLVISPSGQFFERKMIRLLDMFILLEWNEGIDKVPRKAP